MGTMVSIFFGCFFSVKMVCRRFFLIIYFNISGYHNGGSDINYDSEVPNPPQDNNQVAAWYDTDL